MTNQGKKVDVKELLSNITLKEKIGQLLQLTPMFLQEKAVGEITGPMGDLGIDSEDIKNCGSILGIGGAEEVMEIQKNYLENSKHKIPLLFMADVIHGYRTIFPIPLALGCSWDEEIVEETSRVAAREASAGGVHVTFSPMVDLVRDARWGRVMESTGEDPYLNSIFAKAAVRGYQGDDLSKDGNIAACVKHFAAYGAPEGGREYNTVDISERMLREYYLPAYKAAIEEGCKMLMTSFNTVNSVPSSGNEWLMREVLRNEWSYDGVVISDWAAIKELIPHGVAEDEREAAEKAMKAGVDIEMMTGCYPQWLEKLIEEGKISIELIDQAVFRILKLKEELGLFADPYKGLSKDREASLNLCEEHRNIARKAAAASMVLLKNDGSILPFSKETGKVAVIGPYADEQSILGWWSWQGKAEDAVSLKQGIINKIGSEKVVAAKGCDIIDSDDDKIVQAVELAKTADVIVLALGEAADMSGEGASRAFIKLSGKQEQLADEILKLNKPTAIVLFNGRPIEITELYGKAPAVLEAWFPGTEGGNAAADILFGDKNPTGRLSMSFPYTVGQVPVYYNEFNTGRPKIDDSNTERYVSHYSDIPNAPLLPFGYGLSYTTFKYENFMISDDTLTEDSSIAASVMIKNTGSVDGEEIVQLYIRDISGSVVRPVKELKGYKKIYLKAGEERQVSFEIREDMLRFYNSKMELKSEKGKFNVMVGPNSKELMTLEFKLI
ncbi:beta-glucosidase BglX [Clostridium oryzae]|uniref:beta-glucosidase n=1 Tax=Clostridium oryzae TaxID=1450648 RepID=A0A1V4IQ39_9CLOT|nr:beta-glucosidase BglX [Clostridium oryzae]OPJ62132.1 periplasmic beta-glucosidase precursor [Clostridium oryzae]